MPQPDLKYVGTRIRQAYYDTLNGNISVGGTNYPVYNRVPPEQTPPYIRITSSGANPEQMLTKDSTGWNITIVVAIVNKYKGREGGEKDNETALNEITKLVRRDATRLMDLGSSWEHISTTVDSVNQQQEQTDTGYIFQHNITFRHLIEQL